MTETDVDKSAGQRAAAARETRRQGSPRVQLLSSPSQAASTGLQDALALGQMQPDGRFAVGGRVRRLLAYDASTPPPKSDDSRVATFSAASSEEIVAELRLKLRAEGVAKKRENHLVRQARQITALLETFDGSTWDERWLNSGLDSAPRAMMRMCDSTSSAARATTESAWLLICVRAIRPSYSWLLNVGKNGAWHERFWQFNDPEGVSQLRALPGYNAASILDRHNAEHALLRVAIRTGKPLLQLTGSELLHYADIVRTSGRARREHLAWELMVQLGPFSEEAPTLRAMWSAKGNTRQHSVETLVDRYGLRPGPVRNLLVDYLAEIRPGMDYGSLEGVAYRLVRLFWWQVLQIEPTQQNLRLSPSTAAEWLRCVQVNLDGSPRLDQFSVLQAVRAFYRDISEWAHDDPVRWGIWAAPCPVPRSMKRMAKKMVTQRKSRMDARTRSLTSLLPAFLTAAAERKEFGRALMEAALQHRDGEEFEVSGYVFARYDPPVRSAKQARVLVWVRVIGGEAGRRPLPRERGMVNVSRLEETSFWMWAMVNVLKHAGIRIEELQELTQLSIRHHTPASTNTVVPLLHIVPSKNDTERLIPMSPELVGILVEVLRRAKGGEEHVPLSVRYDQNEKVHSAPFPHLFARKLGARYEVFSMSFIRENLIDLAEYAGITDAGVPLTFQPHDFRRLFTTEMVGSGLPIHIVASLLGHLNLETTRGYTTVFEEKLIEAHQRFIERRRALRDPVEREEATPTQWAEFQEHFTLRRVALGDCHRPYGTPCVHEHACTRCRFLRVDPAQLGRIESMEENTEARLEEAQGLVWLGEVSALEEQLVHPRKRKQEAISLLSGDQPLVHDGAKGAG